MEDLSEQMTFQLKPTRKGEAGQPKHQMTKFQNRRDKDKAARSVRATERRLVGWKYKNTHKLAKHKQF